MQRLIQQLRQIDGKSYKAYKDIQGNYSHEKFNLHIDYVQGDPFASPSKIRMVIPYNKRPLQDDWLRDGWRKLAVEDIFARSIAKAVHQNTVFIKGSGKSGAILFDGPGQEILERSAVEIAGNGKEITVCISVGLPANGRRINGKEAEKLFTKALPSIMDHSVFAIKDDSIIAAVHLADQQAAIRQKMQENGWISFIANGSILPRKSGVSDRPMPRAIPFQSPPENEVEFEIPHRAEPLKGMAVSKGITLIVGGGYHGKSTVLESMERGVYPHTAGDGREYVLTDPDAVKIRAEDGRKITNVSISPFINHLPFEQDIDQFTTDDASGSTSQAANVMETLEAGASVLLIDEDTSATNFMIRDYRMQLLVQKEKEPITPFIDQVRNLYRTEGVSTILVMGGSGDYFNEADDVIMMDVYQPYNVTDEAYAIIEEHPLKRHTDSVASLGNHPERYFQPQSLQTQKGKRSKTQAKGPAKILMGKNEIVFDAVEQLVDTSQTRMIAEIIQYLDRKEILGALSVGQLLDTLEEKMDEQGIRGLTMHAGKHPGDIARPRRHEIAAVLNRMRTATIKRGD